MIFEPGPLTFQKNLRYNLVIKDRALRIGGRSLYSGTVDQNVLAHGLGMVTNWDGGYTLCYWNHGFCNGAGFDTGGEHSLPHVYCLGQGKMIAQCAIWGKNGELCEMIMQRISQLDNSIEAHASYLKEIFDAINQSNDERNNEIRTRNFQKRLRESQLRTEQRERKDHLNSIFETQHTLWQTPPSERSSVRAKLESEVRRYESKYNVTLEGGSGDYTTGCSCSIL